MSGASRRIAFGFVRLGQNESRPEALVAGVTGNDFDVVQPALEPEVPPYGKFKVVNRDLVPARRLPAGS